MPSFNPGAPGGVGFGTQGSGGGYQTNQYYDLPLDDMIRRMNDPSLYDSTDNIERRHSYYHVRNEDNMKGYLLKPEERAELKEEDIRLRLEDVLSNPPQPIEEPVAVHQTMEQLLDRVRVNNDSHPFEDVSPDPVKPLRRHAQLYTSRGTGGTVFNPASVNDRSPYEVRYRTMPDGNARKYDGLHGDSTGTTGRAVQQYLDSPVDHNFHQLFGETLAFDWPQDRENANATGNRINEVIKEMMTQLDSQGTERSQRIKSFLEGLMKLPNGIGKARALYTFLGDGMKQYDETMPEVMGVAEKYQSPIQQLVGTIPHAGAGM